uniref:Uncharacterized protein n=1 Tax=Amphimedon queenslandica TaxID=400682 RepID=A0A1X7TDU6_AMPQE
MVYCYKRSAHTPAGIADVEETFQNEPKKEIVESLAKKGKTAVKRHDKLKDNLSEFYTPSSKKRRTN